MVENTQSGGITMNRSEVKMKLSEEIELIQKMRNEGLTYQDIADTLEKGYSWVYLRATGRYSVEGGSRSFQRDCVIPWLKEQEHMIVSINSNTLYGDTKIYTDVKSRRNGVYYIWEVKPIFSWKNLQEGIGELVTHKWGWRGKVEQCKYGLLFPESEILKEKVPKSLIEWIKEKEGITIEFLNDRGGSTNEKKEEKL